jgi:hypothetical protein
MTTIGAIPFAVGIFAIAIVWLIVADSLDKRKIARCVCKIRFAVCPKCKQALGEQAESTAKQKTVKFLIHRFGRLRRSRDYPSRLVTVVCPHCSTELEFRLDGSLFSCDGVIAT